MNDRRDILARLDGIQQRVRAVEESLRTGQAELHAAIEDARADVRIMLQWAALDAEARQRETKTE